MMEWFEEFLAKNRKHMPPRERLGLSTWQKFSLYGRIPWKFITNLILVIFSTTQVILWNQNEAPYLRANMENWANMLAPPPGVASDGEGAKMTYFIYRSKNLLLTLQTVRDTYYGIQNTSVDTYQFFTAASGQIEPITLSVSQYAAGVNVFDPTLPFDNSKIHTQFLIGTDDLGPFSTLNATESQKYIHSTDSMTASFRIKSFNLALDRRTCWEWNVDATFDFSVRGRCTYTTSSDYRLCPEEATVPWYERDFLADLVLDFFLIFFAAISQVLYFRAVWRSIVIYQQVKRQSQQSDNAVWADLSCRDKMRFFNAWFIIATIGNVGNITGSILDLQSVFDVRTSSNYQLYFTGLGCMMTWINLVQYFESTTTYYILIATLMNGTPRVIRFLIGCLPVFLGYAMFGVAYFSASSANFATLDQACVTLFALLNGDVVHDIFGELYPAHPTISRIYLYTFISLFIYAVLNIFIAIIEDAFFASKQFQEHTNKHKHDLNKIDPLHLVDLVMPPEQDKDGSSTFMSSHMDASHARPNESGNTHRGTILHSPFERSLTQKSLGPSSVGSELATPLLLEEEEEEKSPGRRIAVDSTDDLSHAFAIGGAGYQPPGPSQAVTHSSNPLVQALSQTEGDFTADFQQHLNQLLSQQGVAAHGSDPWTTTLRPPHDVSYYPCQFADCLYCTVRRIYVDGLIRVRAELKREIEKTVKSGASGSSSTSSRS